MSAVIISLFELLAWCAIDRQVALAEDDSARQLEQCSETRSCRGGNFSRNYLCLRGFECVVRECVFSGFNFEAGCFRALIWVLCSFAGSQQQTWVGSEVASLPLVPAPSLPHKSRLTTNPDQLVNQEQPRPTDQTAILVKVQSLDASAPTWPTKRRRRRRRGRRWRSWRETGLGQLRSAAQDGAVPLEAELWGRTREGRLTTTTSRCPGASASRPTAATAQQAQVNNNPESDWCARSRQPGRSHGLWRKF